MDIVKIKSYLELAGAITLLIASLIIIFKMLFKKIDKNKNGKIEKEEITEADMQFIKNLMQESIKTIASGIFKNSGLNNKQTYNFMLNEIKNSKNIIEKTIKEEEKNENEKNS